MALQKQIVTLPLGAKLDEGTDPKLVNAASAVAVARNVIFRKEGRTEKAPGYGYEAAAALNTGSVNDVLKSMHSVQSDGTNILAGGIACDPTTSIARAEGYHVAAARISAASYDPIGHWYPIQQTKRTACGNRSSALDPDCCYTAAAGSAPAAIWHAWIEGGAVKMCTNRASDGAPLTTPSQWTINGATSSVTRVRLLTVGAYVHLYVGSETALKLAVIGASNVTTGAIVTANSIGTLPGKAWFDFGAVCTNFDSILEAKTAGWEGNYITVQLATDAALSVTVTPNVYGYAVLIKFISGVTTVTQVEAAIAALAGASDVIEVKTAGTGTNVLAAGDVLAATNLAGAWNLWDAIKISAGTPAADVAIVAYLDSVASQLVMTSHTAAGAAGAYGPTTIAVQPGYSLAIAKNRVTTGGQEAIAVVYEAAAGANVGSLCLMQRTVDATFSSYLAETAFFATTTDYAALTALAICQERITEHQESSACAGLAVWAEFAEQIATALPWRRVVRPFVLNAGTGAVKRNVLGPWFNHRLMTRAIENDYRSHVWLVHDSETWPVCSLVSLGKITSTLRHIETEATWLRALPLWPQARSGFGSGLGSILSTGATPDVYYWPAITADQADSVNVTASAYTYGLTGIHAAAVGAARVTGGGQLMGVGPSRIFPHGFAHPPEIVSLSSAYSEATYTDALQGGGRYRYLAIYEYIDAVGELHRSAPSVSSEIEVAANGYTAGQTLVITGANDDVDLEFEESFGSTSATITALIPTGTYASWDELGAALAEAIMDQLTHDGSLGPFAIGCAVYCWKDINPMPEALAATWVPDCDPARFKIAFYNPGDTGLYLKSAVWSGCSAGTPLGFGTTDQDASLSEESRETMLGVNYVVNVMSIVTGVESLDLPESTTAAAVTVSVRPLAPGEYFRNVQDVRIGIYRTEAGGTTYHRIGEIVNAFSDYDLELTDTVSDATALTKALAYTTGEPGDVLEHTTPVGSKAVWAHRDRVWMRDEENPRSVFVSLPKADGYAVEFSEFSKVELPEAVLGGASLGEVSLVFTASACYGFHGQGVAASGQGEWSSPRLLAAAGIDSQSSVGTLGDLVVWHSAARGLWAIDRGYQAQEIGKPVLDQLAGGYTVKAMVERADERRLEIALSSGSQVWVDQRFDRMTEQTGFVGLVDACAHGSATWHVQDSTGSNRVCYQAASTWTRNGTAHAMLITTAWIHVGALTGMQRVWWEHILGDWRDSHTIRVRRWVDFITGTEDSDRSVVMATDPGPYLLKHCPRTQMCSAVKLEISDVPSGSGGAGFRLTALELEVGIKRGRMARGKVR